MEEDAKVKEIEIKTHKFFRLNKYGKGILTGVVYFGDTIRIKDSWIPHGYGEYKVNGEVLYEGDFSRGKMHGRGNYLFANGNTWKGTFRFDELHGVGMLELAEREGVENTGPRECIFHKNKKVCFTDELLPGFHIKLLRQGGYLHSPGATILGKTKKNGHFRVKLDIGGVENINLLRRPSKLTWQSLESPFWRTTWTRRGTMGPAGTGLIPRSATISSRTL